MTPIYHITHVNNLASIVRDERLWCDGEMENRDCITIGYRSLKDRRAGTEVTVSKYGTLADYIPFYFAPRSPMLFKISHGAVDFYEGGQDPIVYLVSTIELVVKEKLPFCFTDGHAVMALSKQYDDLDHLNRVDWKIMRERYWNDTNEDGDRKRRRMAEFLVHNFFPWSLIGEIGVFDSKRKQKVEKLIGSDKHKPVVTIHRDWYY